MPTLTQTRSFLAEPADWSGTASFAAFDPALGTLDSIGLGLATTLSSSASFQSGEATASTVAGGISGAVTLSRPDGAALLTTYATVSRSAALAAGSTVGSARTVDGSAAATATLTAPPAQAGSGAGGVGTVSLPVTATARVNYDGPANLSARFASSISASATVSYSYTPRTGVAGAGSNSGVVFTNVPGIAVLPAEAVTTAGQTRNVSDQTTGWLSGLAFAQFDPSLGQLLEVNVTVAGDLVGTIRAQNLDPIAADISVSETSKIAVARPDGQAIAATQAQLSLSRTLGSSDTAQLVGTQTSTATTGDANPADLALFTGTGTVTLPVLSDAASRINGPGNLATDTTAKAGALVTLSYTYLPGASSPAPISTPAVTGVGFGETRTVGAGGSTTGETVGFGGTQLVAVGGSAARTSVGPAGVQHIAGGGSASDTFVQGSGRAATVQVDAGGMAIGLTIAGLGFAEIAGQSSGTTLNGGTEIVTAGGHASGTVVNDGGTQEVVGGQASATVVNTGGTVLVDAAGKIDGARIAGGTMCLDAGATAHGVTFTGSGVLALGSGASSGTISGFAAGDTLDLTSLTFDGTAAATLGAGNVLHVSEAAGSVDLQLDPAASYAGQSLHLARDAAGIGTALTLDPGLAVSGAGLVSTRAYTGPVDGIQGEFVAASANPVIVTAATDSWFLKGGPGEDALAAHGGTNVLDGGTGSNFLVGAAGADGGADTFFTDARGGGVVWNTMVNFHAGDSATLWGFDPSIGAWHWDGVSGADGYTGATLRADVQGTGTTNASITFAGITTAQAQSLQVSTGTVGGLSYLYFHSPGA